MKRSGSRNKFLMCFRPVVEMEDCNFDDGLGLPKSKSAALLSIDRSNSHALLVSSDEITDSTENKGILLDRSVSDCSAFAGGRRSVSSERSSSDQDEVVVPTNHHRRRKSFSRAIKAALFEPMMSKRANDRKSMARVANESNRGSSLTRMDSMDKEQYNSIRKEFDERLESKSSSSSSSSSSLASSGSLPSLSSGSDSETPSKSSSVGTKKTQTRKPEPQPEPDRKKSGSLTVCLLLLTTLAVTVLGGKFLGVALTLICLYSLPPLRQGLHVVDPPAGEARTSPVENRVSREYKKQRVVIEGMLKRNHRNNHRHYLNGQKQSK